ncbi:MAG: hypothetical protein HEEMFOPI_00922 [Holosporales bacterium]
MKAEKQDDFIKKISFDLVKLNIADFVRVYFATFVHGIGGYYPFILVCLAFFFGIIVYIKTNHQMFLFLWITSFLQISNYGFVFLMQPILRRYVFYTDTFYVISVMILLTIFYDFVRRRV